MPHSDLAVFSLDADADFAASVARALGISPAAHEEREFDDGEHKIRPLESVRQRDVYLIQSLYAGPRQGLNEKLIRVLFLANALRDHGAAHITLVAPYLAYARKDRRTKARDPVSTRYLAQMIEGAGVNRVAAMEVHNPAAFENSFRCPTETLHLHGIFADHFARNMAKSQPCVVSPDPGGVKRAEAFRASLEHRLGRPVDTAFLPKTRSQGEVRGQGRVAGRIEDRDVIIFDDLIASGTTMTRAARTLVGQGARSVHAAATHGLFSPDSDDILAVEALDTLVVTNTVPPFRLTSESVQARLAVLDATPLTAEVVRRLHEGESIVNLLAD